MLKTRDYVQENGYDVGTSGTKTFDLDYQDPISQIDLYWYWVNGATTNIGSPIERCISKIEIVDGGQVLWDATGEVALALFATDNEGMPYHELEECANATQREQIPIRFGRWLWDRDFAFNPLRHQHPQLRVTFNEAAINAAGATGFVTDSTTLSIIVRLMEQGSSPAGFLSARNIETFTSLGSGTKRVELPVDRPIRYLIPRAWETAVSWQTTWTNLKLSLDGGKFIPFDMSGEFFRNRMCETFRPLFRREKAVVSDDTARETFISYNQWILMTGSYFGHIFCHEVYMDGRQLPYINKHDGASASGLNAFVETCGWALHGTNLYPFGDRWTPDDWFVPSPQGTLDLFITEGNAGADCDIALQQFYRY